MQISFQCCCELFKHNLGRLRSWRIFAKYLVRSGWKINRCSGTQANIPHEFLMLSKSGLLKFEILKLVFRKLKIRVNIFLVCWFSKFLWAQLCWKTIIGGKCAEMSKFYLAVSMTTRFFSRENLKIKSVMYYSLSHHKYACNKIL